MSQLNSVRAILIAAFVLSGCAPKEQKSVIVDYARNGGAVVVDPTSIREIGDKVIIAQAIIYPKEEIDRQEQKGMWNPVVGQDSLIQFDCNQRTYQMIEHEWVYKNGKSDPMGDKAVKVVPPKSPLERTMDYACTSEWKRWFERVLGG